MITEQEVRAAFKLASKETQEYVESRELYDAFQSIRATHKLHLDQAGDLELALHAVILGMKKFEDFKSLARDALKNIDAATQDAILVDINKQIFEPLRQAALDKARDQADDEEAQRQARAAIAAEEQKLAAEDVPPIRTAPKPSVMEQKMAGATTTAPTAEKISTPTTPTALPPPAAPTPASAPTTPPKYHGTDPYREPPA